MTTALVDGVATLCCGGAWSHHIDGRVTTAFVAGAATLVVVEQRLTTRAVECRPHPLSVWQHAVVGERHITTLAVECRPHSLLV